MNIKLMFIKIIIKNDTYQLVTSGLNEMHFSYPIAEITVTINYFPASKSFFI